MKNEYDEFGSVPQEFYGEGKEFSEAPEPEVKDNEFALPGATAGDAEEIKPGKSAKSIIYVRGAIYGSAALVFVISPMTGSLFSGVFSGYEEEEEEYYDWEDDEKHASTPTDSVETEPDEDTTYDEPYTGEYVIYDLSFMDEGMGEIYSMLSSSDLYGAARLIDELRSDYISAALDRGVYTAEFSYTGDSVEEGYRDDALMVGDISFSGDRMYISVAAGKPGGHICGLYSINYNGENQITTMEGDFDSELNSDGAERSSFLFPEGDPTTITIRNYTYGPVEAGHFSGDIMMVYFGYSSQSFEVTEDFKKVDSGMGEGWANFQVNSKGRIPLDSVDYLDEDVLPEEAYERGYSYVLARRSDGSRYLEGIVKLYDGGYTYNGYQVESDEVTIELFDMAMVAKLYIDMWNN